MHRVFLLVAALGLLCQPALAQNAPANARSVELDLSNQALQGRFDTPTSVGGEGSRLVYSLFLSEDRDVVGSAALLLNSNLNFGAFELRFGPQAYAALLNEENEDVFAIALGVDARFNILPSRGIAIAGTAFYSPDVLTFGSADNLKDFAAWAEMNMSDKLTLLAGYRWFKLDLLMAEQRELQSEVFIGARWQLH